MISFSESYSLLLLYFLPFLLSDESDSLDDESEGDGSDSGSAGKCAFHFRFEESVAHVDKSSGCVDESVGLVCDVGSRIFVLIGIESFGDNFPLVVFVPIGLESKGGRLIEIFWPPKS